MPTVRDVVVRKPTEQEEAECKKWPVWSHAADTFNWAYTQTETCLLIEGEVMVSDGANSVSFAAGDYVVFPVDLECTWDIKKAVRKYYNFS